MHTRSKQSVRKFSELKFHEHHARVLESFNRLRDKNLLGEDHLSMSVRIPGRDAFAFLDLDRPESLATQTPGGVLPRAKQVVILDFAGQPLPTEEPEAGIARLERRRLHGGIYAARPDVGAIVLNRPLWGGALAQIQHPMPGIFDEQARQMGPRVERLPANIVTGSGLAPEILKILRGGANVFIYEEHALCLGMTRERAIFNSELLEKCAKAYVLALATGQPIRRIPWFVRFIAHRRLLKDERRSAAAYARGEIPTGFTAY